MSSFRKLAAAVAAAALVVVGAIAGATSAAAADPPTATGMNVSATTGETSTINLDDGLTTQWGGLMRVGFHLAGGADATDDGTGVLSGDDSVLTALDASFDDTTGQLTITPTVAGEFSLTWNAVGTSDGVDQLVSNDASLTVDVSDPNPDGSGDSIGAPVASGLSVTVGAGVDTDVWQLSNAFWAGDGTWLQAIAVTGAPATTAGAGNLTGDDSIAAQLGVAIDDSGDLTLHPAAAGDYTLAWVGRQGDGQWSGLGTIRVHVTDSHVLPLAESFDVTGAPGDFLSGDLNDHTNLAGGTASSWSVGEPDTDADAFADADVADFHTGTWGFTVPDDGTCAATFPWSVTTEAGASSTATMTLYVVSDGCPDPGDEAATEPTDPPTTDPVVYPSDGVALRPAGSDGMASAADRQVTTVDTPVRITGLHVGGTSVAQLVATDGVTAVIALPTWAGSSAVVEDTGAVLYTPAPGFVGTDTVTIFAGGSRVGTFMVLVNEPAAATNAISATVTVQAELSTADANMVSVEFPLSSLPICDLSAGVAVISWSEMPTSSSGYAGSNCATGDVDVMFDEPTTGFLGAAPTLTYWSPNADPVSLTVNVTPPAAMWEARDGSIGSVSAAGSGGWNLVGGRLPDGDVVQLVGDATETDDTTNESTTATDVTVTPAGRLAYSPSIPSGTLTVTWRIAGAGQDDVTYTTTIVVIPVSTSTRVHQVWPWYFAWAGEPVTVSPVFGADAIPGAMDLTWTYQPDGVELPGTVTGSGSSFIFTPDAGFTGTTAFTFLSDQQLDGYGVGERVPVTVYVTVFGPVVADHSITVQAGSWATTDDLLDPVLWGTVADLRTASDDYIAHSSLAASVGGTWWVERGDTLLNGTEPGGGPYVPVPVADDAAMPSSSADMAQIDDPLGDATFDGTATMAGSRAVRLMSPVVQQSLLPFVAVTSDGIIGAPANIRVTVTPAIANPLDRPTTVPDPPATPTPTAPAQGPTPIATPTVAAAPPTDPTVPTVVAIGCDGKPGVGCTGSSDAWPLAGLAALFIAAGVGAVALRRRFASR